ncbi:glutaredoxin family protein [Nitrincola sp. MINF-07-Sa-05]|uniref:glutaredoxin family protein n=1 Tax=Nitrincola salilacus TaxID=3400273 RepID=UPI003918531E
MRSFELMTTLGCHLCDDAAQILVVTMNEDLHEVELVDIAYDDQLMERYATRIPVLRDTGNGRELDWPFDRQALETFLNTCGD